MHRMQFVIFISLQLGHGREEEGTIMDREVKEEERVRKVGGWAVFKRSL